MKSPTQSDSEPSSTFILRKSTRKKPIENPNYSRRSLLNESLSRIISQKAQTKRKQRESRISVQKNIQSSKKIKKITSHRNKSEEPASVDIIQSKSINKIRLESISGIRSESIEEIRSESIEKIRSESIEEIQSESNDKVEARSIEKLRQDDENTINSSTEMQSDFVVTKGLENTNAKGGAIIHDFFPSENGNSGIIVFKSHSRKAVLKISFPKCFVIMKGRFLIAEKGVFDVGDFIKAPAGSKLTIKYLGDIDSNEYGKILFYRSNV